MSYQADDTKIVSGGSDGNYVPGVLPELLNHMLGSF